MLQFITSISLIINLLWLNPSADFIKQTREQISHINISFYGNNYPKDTSLNELSESLGKLLNEKVIPETIKSQKDYKKEINQLFDSYKEFKKFYQTKPELDTLKKVFRSVNNNFNSLYGKYFLNELRKSSKQKVILFSASMSCECTMEMCYKQEAEIQKLLKENRGMFEYAVIDAYENSELQDQFKVGFIPSVIMQDTIGKEMRRLIRTENLYTEMRSFLITSKLK
jgi:hypothetical protein